MDTQEACSGFMIEEEDIVEEDENIVIDWYLEYSFYIMKKECWRWTFIWHVLDNFVSPPRLGLPFE